MAANTNKICFKSAGMIMTLILYPLTIINIILSRYDYQQTYLNWFSGTGFRVFGVVQLSTVIIAFASATIAFFVFSCLSDNKGAIFLVRNFFYLLAYFIQRTLNAPHFKYFNFFHYFGFLWRN